MKSIFITGASSGIGRGLSLAFAEPGVLLGIMARREDELNSLAQEIRERGAAVRVYRGDVRDQHFVESSLDEFSKEENRLDIVIANAGRGEGSQKQIFDATVAQEVISLNIQGVVNTLYPAARMMRSQGYGTLVGMSSAAAYGALPGSLIYSPTKAAVKLLMKGLSLELHHDGVTTVCLCPGFIRTPLTDKNKFPMPFMLELDDASERMKQAILLKKRVFIFPRPFFMAAQLLRIAPKWLLLRFSMRKK